VLYHNVVEPSEEVRLLLCRMARSLVAVLLERGAGAVLHPYFHEVVMVFQANLSDPYPVSRFALCLSSREEGWWLTRVSSLGRT
jgi:hypothetical protein